jgi:hypothetical protein
MYDIHTLCIFRCVRQVFLIGCELSEKNPTKLLSIKSLEYIVNLVLQKVLYNSYHMGTQHLWLVAVLTNLWIMVSCALDHFANFSIWNKSVNKYIKKIDICMKFEIYNIHCNVPIFWFPCSVVGGDLMSLCRPDQRGKMRLIMSSGDLEGLYRA